MVPLIAVVRVATHGQLHAAILLLAGRPALLPCGLVGLAIVQHLLRLRAGHVLPIATPRLLLNRPPVGSLNGRVAVEGVARPADLHAAKGLLHFGPAELPIREARLAVKLLHAGGVGAAEAFELAAPTDLVNRPGVPEVRKARLAVVQLALGAADAAAIRLLLRLPSGPPLVRVRDAVELLDLLRVVAADLLGLAAELALA
mmetsp:Transcript_62459/g.181085  ORF Transcript_62459/g.181085 Transcript_62459/m.181085 type:complete len:201 (-) Transcript_62459:540-1142(-)